MTGIFVDGKPLLAYGSIGMGLHQKTIQMLHSILDFGYSPDEAASAPAFGSPEFTATGLTERTSIVEGKEVNKRVNFSPANWSHSPVMGNAPSGMPFAALSFATISRISPSNSFAL